MFLDDTVVIHYRNPAFENEYYNLLYTNLNTTIPSQVHYNSVRCRGSLKFAS
jgi:hypothetical protein